MQTRLTSMDASFLEVESPTAHMHVGWVALFRPQGDRPLPDFRALREHVAARLPRAPRYRQRLLRVPLRLNDPIWVDDTRFDIDEHVVHSPAAEIGQVVDEVLSVPLRHDRPLWELWVADRLADGRVGIVGKAHHCMVDGIAAVELASLLLDASPDPPGEPDDGWRPRPGPEGMDLLASAVRDRVLEGARLAGRAAGLVSRPRRLAGLIGDARRAADALGSSMTPAPADGGLNDPISPDRRLAMIGRGLDELRAVRARFGCTVNDVVLAAVSGGLRHFLMHRGVAPPRLKAMVPVNVRGGGDAGALGNRISFMFVPLPCDEPDPVRRLMNVHLATSNCKRRGDAEGGDTVLRAFDYAPRTLQAAVSRLVASPRTFNLVVSNIPGPAEPLYMLGCELEEAYPVVPLADRHALSVGMTTVRDGAFFGVYADRAALPDADDLAAAVDGALDELVELAARPERDPHPEPALV
ncbi:MAG: wax ester/triacylglycerol synthase family O-acyltransferase [Thermoleophilaceae bacterium]